MGTVERRERERNETPDEVLAAVAAAAALVRGMTVEKGRRR